MDQRNRDHFHLARAKVHLMNRDVDRAMRHLDKCGFGGKEGAKIPSEKLLAWKSERRPDGDARFGRQLNR